MIKAATLVEIARFVGPRMKPTPAPIILARHDTAPISFLQPIEVKPRKPRAKRKKHVCPWTNQEVWGAVILMFSLGLFVGHLI